MKQACLCSFIAWLFLHAGGARAAPPRELTQACVAASTQGQTDRDEGRLLAARAELLSCAREGCPSIVKKSCSGWLTEVSERIPSVVVRVHEAGGHDVTDAQVRLDGSAITLDGRPVALDPGTHTLAVDKEGFRPLERTFLIAEREHGRLLVVELQPREVPPAASAPVALVPPPAPLAEAVSRPPEAAPLRTPAAPSPSAHGSPRASSRYRAPLAGWLLGGVAVAGLASFVGLRSKAASDLHELQRTCAPGCTDQQRDHGKRLALGADVSLGISIAAAAGAAGVLLGSWLLSRRETPQTASATSVSLVPTRGGAFAAIAARY